MIVIATHNGNQYLPNLIQSLEQYGPYDQEILIVDNASTDTDFRYYLKTLKSDKLKKLRVVKCTYNAYDTGAYIWAYRNTYADEYMFLQDSLVIKEENWLNKFKEKYHGGLVTWLIFDGNYDDQEQKDFVLSSTGVYDTKGWGVFGPIFYTKRRDLDVLESRGFLDVYPTKKNEQMAMERGWSAICNAASLPHSFIHLHVHNNILEDKYSCFRKFLPKR